VDKLSHDRIGLAKKSRASRIAGMAVPVARELLAKIDSFSRHRTHLRALVPGDPAVAKRAAAGG